MKKINYLLIACLLALALFSGCPKKTPPPEIQRANELIDLVKNIIDKIPDGAPALKSDRKPAVNKPVTPGKSPYDPIYFDFNRSALRPDMLSAMNKIGDHLKSVPSMRCEIRGYCDERGTEQYNLSLGQRRAEAVKQYLISYGVSESNLRTVSYGENAPKCTQSTESCWRRNRRVEVTTWYMEKRML